MALSDILSKIEADAHAQAKAIVADGRRDVDRIKSDASAEAEANRAQRCAEAQRSAEQAANSLLVNARLRARDESLRAQHHILDEVFADAVDKLSYLGTDEWLRVYVPCIADTARSGEQVLLGSKETGRAEELRVALDRAGVQAVIAHTPANFEYGVSIVGDKTSVELSAEQIINQQRRALEPTVKQIVFAGIDNEKSA
jgi:vacuolar-type H+-ATPase subunit E/Vma4